MVQADGPSGLGGGKMAKATKTAKELETKIMREAKASGKCRDLLSVTVLGADILSSNWKIGTASSNQDNHLLSGECRIALDMIVARLQTMYDLAAS
jgi:hypothetical protein